MPPDPRASTSASPAPYPAGPSSATYTDPAPATAEAKPTKTGGKRKKLPSCDSCKLRRVLCCPVAPPGSCPRCQEKGIVCTTTPVIRKKPTGRTGKRIEEARAIFGAADAHAPGLTGPSNTPWIPTHIQARIQDSPAMLPSISSSDIDSRLGLAELSGDLVAHLLGLYQSIPQSWLPLYPRGRLSLMFETVGRRLENLPPHAEVLAHTIIALTSRLSSHPAILGAGSPAPAFEALTETYLSENKDLRQYGQRRESVCNKLRQKAVKMSWERGTLVQSCEESMACCFLLEMLEGRNSPKEGKPYGSAFVSHLRTLLDGAGEQGAPKIMPMSLGWSALIMREALYAANAGRTSHFTTADDLLLCGEPPCSIEAALLENVEHCDVRDSVTLFFGPMRPYTYHVARLARECSDKVTGTHSRKQPLNEHYVTLFLTQLDHLSSLLSILASRIAFVLSPAATSAHSLPAPFETERRYIMAACLYTLQLAWSSLCLPMYLDLKRRVAELGEGPASTAASRNRTKERVELLLKQMHQTTLKAARMVAQSVKNAPSLAFLTHLTQERLGIWAEILLEAKTVEEGGEGITVEERSSDLAWMVDGLKTMAWSWSDDAPLIASLEFGISNLQLSAASRAPPPTQSAPQQVNFLDFDPASFPAASAPPPASTTSTAPAAPSPELDFSSYLTTPLSPLTPPSTHASGHSTSTSALGAISPELLTQLAAAAGFPGVSAETISSFLGSMGPMDAQGMQGMLGMFGVDQNAVQGMATGMGMDLSAFGFGPAPAAALAVGGGEGGESFGGMLGGMPGFEAAASGQGAPSVAAEAGAGEGGGGEEWMNI